MVFVFLAPGFEESEAICPIDILRRAELDVVTVSITDDREVTGAHGITVKADVSLSELPLCHAEAIVLPGGMPGTKNLEACAVLQDWIRLAQKDKALLCAICAAPMILGKMGILEGKKATCYPGFEQYLLGATVVGGSVRTEDNVITACGMGAAIEFGLAIVAALKGIQASEKIKNAILAR
ncbi:MAG: DJ-1/PfpI family protein [Ruminococcaceae bacterium]|nr:DJ-1/PfpI family protein [Oscillospiraceae bacterium]